MLPIADRHIDDAQGIENTLRDEMIRAKVATSSEGLGAKIRNAQLAKVPYMLVVGDKDMENNTVSVRSRSAGDLGATSLS